MPHTAIDKMTNAMDRLKAQDQLKLMDAFSYTSKKDNDRKKNHREWYKKAYPENFEAKVVRNEDLILST